MPWAELERQALAARDRAYCPYSDFAVGAALLCEDGTVVTGANVENRSYPVTVCAERSAVVAANAAGQRSFRALAIAADNRPPARPCGLCLETLAEFSTGLPIVLINLDGERVETDLAELLPQPFRFTEADGSSEEGGGPD
ncbi:MAG: cytidine deaminase [Acidobacteria bacterium]|nr:MAG: cytidine deaminase [Acidobacteriota bacterium]REK12217.1 MAG: cytidine deaminase [Acidobacteriota bacterium]